MNPNVQVWQGWPPEVEKAALAAAGDVAARYGVELADMEQEARIYIATHAETIASRADTPSHVRRRVRDELSRQALREVRRRERECPLPEWEVESEDL